MSVVTRTPILELKSVSFSYHDSQGTRKDTLSEVSFELFPGETLGVVGHNGSGKSTLLRLLAGVMNPCAGEVLKEAGVRCSLLSLGVGYMNDLTGADNVVLNLILQGMTELQARALLPEIQAFADLDNAFYGRVKAYSSGMRSRLTFSAALYSHPDILLIDEVLAVGDGNFKAKARAALSERIKGDQTVIFVSHSESAVRNMCDRVLWLDGGQVRMYGATEVVLEEYEGTFNKGMSK